MAERVQQSKLAALGRLSASIAHEIRNPVGAMSHAGQLLAESPNMGPDDHRLTDIIRNNSERVSTIINNVLQLSRREATKPSRLIARRLARRVLARVLSNHAGSDRSRSACTRGRTTRGALRSQPPASSGLEPMRQRHQIRRAARRDQGRNQARPPEPELPALPGGRRPRDRHRARGGRSDLRAVFYGPKGRHRARTVHRPRTLPVEPRRSCSTSRAAAAAACSGSCSATHSAGRNNCKKALL